MKNAISYFYKINLESIQKINKNYYFYYANNSYVIHNYLRNEKELSDLYKLNHYMLNLNIPVYEIILTVEGNVAFLYENDLFVLMKLPNISNRTITINDLFYFKGLLNNNNFNSLDKSNWSILWTNRVDYSEKQVIKMENKYPLLDESLPYYIGICENAISYLNSLEIHYTKKEVCHKRITYDMDLLSFLNPLELVIDYQTRDLAEYFKSYVLSANFSKEDITKFLNEIPLSKEESILFIVRFMFPSYYFDAYDKIINNDQPEDILLNIIKKHEYIESILNLLFKKYSNYNLIYIDWLKNKNYISS